MKRNAFQMPITRINNLLPSFHDSVHNRIQDFLIDWVDLLPDVLLQIFQDVWDTNIDSFL